MHDEASAPVAAHGNTMHAPETRRDREQAQKRVGILKTAAAFFEDKGYQATTVAEIAEAANVSVGTLYKFFSDKESLYQSLVAQTMQEFEAAGTRSLRDTPGDELAKLMAYVETTTHLFFKHLRLIRVYYAETGAAFVFSAPGIEGEAFKSYWRIVDALRDTFSAGIDRGLFTALPAAALAATLEGVHNAFLSAIVRDENAYPPDQIIDLTRRIFFDRVALTA